MAETEIHCCCSAASGWVTLKATRLLEGCVGESRGFYQSDPVGAGQQSLLNPHLAAKPLDATVITARRLEACP
jgi:hypothetical protein